MAEIKYIDQNGLQQAIAALKVKTDAAYLAKDGVAEAAKKLNAAVQINGVNFDGSANIEIDAPDHDHVMADITDLQAAMDNKVNVVENHSLVADTEIAKIHEHANKAELDKVVNGKVAEWDAKIGVNDANLLVYENTNMSTVANVKGALDTLAGVNVTMVEDIEALEEAIGVAADAVAGTAATGLHKVIADGDAQALADAKAYADQQITALVDSAPDAMNTLNELATAINDHQGVYEDYIETVSQNIASAKDAAIAEAQNKDDALKLVLQQEIDADVKVEKDRAEGVEAGFETRIKALEDAEVDTHVALTQAEIEAAINNAWV